MKMSENFKSIVNKMLEWKLHQNQEAFQENSNKCIKFKMKMK